ncbi:hypothetical protein RRG08_063873 [Elysia crispata]|uniref:Uncharacterized protein n=1 Tax=Elysia crispata TaxID=231223 RepID=A0AAE1B6Q6_9GAST|nr:hypothetical protein RRG08_063873 [Elysia crispata]
MREGSKGERATRQGEREEDIVQEQVKIYQTGRQEDMVRGAGRQKDMVRGAGKRPISDKAPSEEMVEEEQGKRTSSDRGGGEEDMVRGAGKRATRQEGRKIL